MITSILTYLLITFVSAVIATFLGYWIHWLLHQPWSLWFYSAHMNHHKLQYPSTDFFSDKYRSAGKDSTVILFVLVFMPIILALGALSFFGILSWSTSIYTLINLAAWGLIHNYLHDKFHLNNTFWKNIPLFLKWQSIHYIHHLEMNANYGIVLFVWDKLFKTYIGEEKSPLTQGE